MDEQFNSGSQTVRSDQTLTSSGGQLPPVDLPSLRVELVENPLQDMQRWLPLWVDHRDELATDKELMKVNAELLMGLLGVWDNDCWWSFLRYSRMLSGYFFCFQAQRDWLMVAVFFIVYGMRDVVMCQRTKPRMDIFKKGIFFGRGLLGA